MKYLLLDNNEWDYVHQITEILSPFNKYTKKLQSEVVTLSDFFGYWTTLRIKLAKSDDELSINLLDEMNNYHEMLMMNPAMLGAVYLDPRYQRGLKDKKPTAKQFLVNLFLKMKKVESYSETQEEESAEKTDTVVCQSGTANESDSFDDMERYLNACDSAHKGPESSIAHDGDAINEIFISELLNGFDGYTDSIKSSIFDIWQNKMHTHTDLYRLAMVVFTIPPTQTSVERCFSALPFILRPQRTRISDNNLENILLVRLNHDININIQMSINENEIPLN